MNGARALVTGATGAVGPGVVAELQRSGYRVRTLSRHQPDSGLFDHDVETRVGDVTSVADVRDAVSGVSLVVHLAALLHQFGPSAAALDQQYEAVNVGGTANVMREALAEGVSRVVYLSTIAVYGPTRGVVADEQNVPRPDTPYARTKLAAEHIVLAAASAAAQPIGVVLRAAAVYGPRVKGNYRTLADAILRGRYVAIGAGQNRRTLIHEQDLARAIVLAAHHAHAPGRIFNISDGQIHRLEEIVAGIYRAAGKQPARLQLPIWIASALVTVGDAVTKVSGVPLPLTRHTLEKYLEDVAVDGSLAQRVLGFAPELPLEAGWRDTIRIVSRSTTA